MSTRTEDLLRQPRPAQAPAAPQVEAAAHPAAALQRAALPAPRPADLLALQRSVGNRAVGRMLAGRPVQAKLTVNAPGDVYEQEADAVARQVVASLGQPAPAAAEGVQRQPETDDEEKVFTKPAAVQRMDPPAPDEEEKVLTKPALQRSGGSEAAPVDPEVESAIEQARGGGSPMPEGVRGSMEGAFGVDFGGVRIHTGGQSDALNQAVQARAFTTGQDIFFRQGEYDPSSAGGKELLAHELTHVVQQNGPSLARKDRDGQG